MYYIIQLEETAGMSWILISTSSCAKPKL